MSGEFDIKVLGKSLSKTYNENIVNSDEYKTEKLMNII